MQPAYWVSYQIWESDAERLQGSPLGVRCITQSSPGCAPVEFKLAFSYSILRLSHFFLTVEDNNPTHLAKKDGECILCEFLKRSLHQENFSACCRVAFPFPSASVALNSPGTLGFPGSFWVFRGTLEFWGARAQPERGACTQAGRR